MSRSLLLYTLPATLSILLIVQMSVAYPQSDFYNRQDYHHTDDPNWNSPYRLINNTDLITLEQTTKLMKLTIINEGTPFHLLLISDDGRFINSSDIANNKAQVFSLDPIRPYELTIQIISIDISHIPKYHVIVERYTSSYEVAQFNIQIIGILTFIILATLTTLNFLRVYGYKIRDYRIGHGILIVQLTFTFLTAMIFFYK